jgi:hypothetical protein
LYGEVGKHLLTPDDDDDDIAVYRPVAGQRPQNILIQPLLCIRWINKHPFLSNG